MTLLLTAVADTNWLITVSEGGQTLPQFPVHSVVTRLELLSAPSLDAPGITQWERFLEDSAELALTNRVVLRAAEFRRKFGGRLSDSVVAATASLYGIPLLTFDRGMARYASRVPIVGLD